MANTLTNVPAHIASRIAARGGDKAKSAIAAAILGDGSGFNYPKISIRAGRYRLVEDGVETPVGINLDVIIVGANPRTSKIFYDKAYDGSEGVRPACFSNDGMRPDASCANPVHNNCADCPNNVLGSKILPSGAKSKLCSDQRHLAVVPAADPNKVYGITIPVSGMKGLRDYFKDLNNYGVNPEEAITELGFDETASYPKVVFKHKGYVPEKAIARIEALTLSEDVKVAVRLSAPSAGPALAAPEQPVQMSLPGMKDAQDVAAAQFSTPADEAPAPAPAPAKAAKPAKEKPVATGNAAEIEAKLDSLFG